MVQYANKWISYERAEMKGVINYEIRECTFVYIHHVDM